MPTYEFRCPAGHDFEKFYRSIGTAPNEVRCPTCGKIAARQMSAGGLVFKGSGFYITDYGKDGKKPQVAPTAAGETADAKGAGEAAAPKPESTGAGEAAAPAGSAPTPATGKSKAAGGAKPGHAPAKKPKTDE